MIELVIKIPEQLYTNIIEDNCSMADMRILLTIIKHGIQLSKMSLPKFNDFCSYCGNLNRDKQEDKCSDMGCYCYSHWMVDKNNPKAVKYESYIKAEIEDKNW